LENNMKLVRRGAVAVLLAASLTSGALVGVSLAASEDDNEMAVVEEKVAIEILDQDEVAVPEVKVCDEQATATEATTEESSCTGATDDEV
jgi:hypothetical protein